MHPPFPFFLSVSFPRRGERAADRLVHRHGGGGGGGGAKLFNDLAAGIAAGLGYGMMHTVMMYGAVLSASSGEAAWYRSTCPQMNAFALTGEWAKEEGGRWMKWLCVFEAPFLKVYIPLFVLFLSHSSFLPRSRHCLAHKCIACVLDDFSI
jgi:hypothetical protein